MVSLLMTMDQIRLAGLKALSRELGPVGMIRFLQQDDQVFIVENVPARVNLETGEQLFSPETVEQLQQIIREHRKPKRMLQTPVYEFAGG